MKATILFALLTIVSLPAIAQTTQPQQGQAPAAPAAPEKKICHRVAVTGSLLGESVCHTRSEWAQVYKAEHDETQRLIPAPSGDTHSPYGG